MPDNALNVDLAVLGAGPGGYAAAFHAAELGMNVALICDESRPGGVCLLRGCIPSKALLHVARLIHESREAADWGITFAAPQIDLKRLRDWKNSVIDKLTAGLMELAKRRNVHFIRGRGQFAGSQTLKISPANPADPAQVHGAEHHPSHRLAASRPRVHAPRRPAGDGLHSRPGPRRCPPAAMHHRRRIHRPGERHVLRALGSRVTVVELTSGLLPGADRDLVRVLQNHLAKHFQAIHLDTKVEKIEARQEGIAVHVSGGNVTGPVQVFDRVLIAVGRRPNSQGLGLETTKVEMTDRGFVKVDPRRRTTDPHIYAIGDVAGEPMLAHKASREGRIAAETIAGQPAEFDNVAIPSIVFTDPELAWTGLTETEARAQNRPVEIARFPWAASGRAATLGRTDGLTKLVIDPHSQRVLGMGIVGAGAGELIAEGTLAVEMATVARDLADTIHPHPTLSETVMEAAEVFFGQATHLYRPKRQS